MMKTTMKSTLSGPFLIVLLLSSTVSGFQSVLLKNYTHFQYHLTWNEAQSVCRSLDAFTDLATIYMQSDADSLAVQDHYSWISLHKWSISSLWHWSDGSYPISPLWSLFESSPNDMCAVTYYRSQKIYGMDCQEYFFFFCEELKHSNYRYIFVSESKTWSDAQQFCKSLYDDLASFRDNDSFYSTVISYDFPIWIGLHRDGGTWKWSKGLSEYRDWAAQEPQDNSDCISISSLGKKMVSQSCSARFPFMCYNDNLLLVKDSKTWEEALEHCRNLQPPYNSKGYDLVSTQPEDQDYMINKIREANVEEVWAGLRFLAGHWLWVNGANVSYSDLPQCPQNNWNCGILSTNQGSLEIRDCSERRAFLCYRIPV